jgi:hypothetical protein
VIVVRCEQINISGNFHRSKLKYLAFLRKRCREQPSHGPHHYRAPSRIFWRVVRGSFCWSSREVFLLFLMTNVSSSYAFSFIYLTIFYCCRYVAAQNTTWCEGVGVFTCVRRYSTTIRSSQTCCSATGTPSYGIEATS